MDKGLSEGVWGPQSNHTGQSSLSMVGDLPAATEKPLSVHLSSLWTPAPPELSRPGAVGGRIAYKYLGELLESSDHPPTNKPDYDGL